MTNTKAEVFGKYILLEKLAMGGMAEIFLARSNGVQGIGKFMAIKRILPQYSSNKDFIKMFTDEAKICMNLSHSNIAKITEFGIEGGRFFIALELIEGKNLRQILSKLSKENRQGFSVDQAVYIAKNVAAGLDNAHRCLDGASGKPLNIIHRDMSPQNIMISFEGEVKVVDFGIAKADEGGREETKSGTLKGKFSYMSPEQASGEEIDLRTDVYSLGIVLWELLANKRLFASSSEMNTLKKIREGKIPSISKINPNVPEELERIVNIALAKDADNRYQTCAEFYKDLNRFLNRFFPDFSSQDFSIFVKSLYADEVLENRKKYIEYTKLSSEIQEKQSFTDEKTRIESGNDNELLGAMHPNTSVNIDFDDLQVNKTRTNIKNNNTQITGAPPSVKSKIKKMEPKDLFTPANLAVVGLFMTAIALIASQIFGGSSSNSDLDYSLEQTSLESNFAQSFDKHNIVITSTPPGAEIYINGKNTNLLTPGRVSIPAEKSFKIRLQKEGYLSYSSEITSRGNGSKEVFTLQRLGIGFLNIRAKYRNTSIYINNKPLRERLPITGYRVPAGKVLTIKAIDRTRKLYQVKRVKIKSDQKISINFDPQNPL